MANQAADAEKTPREGANSQTTEKLMQLNAAFLVDQLQRLQTAGSLDQLRRGIADLQAQCRAQDRPLFEIDEGGVPFDPALFQRELSQISASRTLRRAQYYVQRLIKSIAEVKTSSINDINLNRWKEYDHIITDSLWIIDRRDSSGVHTADYWGNFIPQIPRQTMLRYTKKGEWVLDPFVGCGTTAIEGQRLGRHTVGIELQADIADQARRLIAAEPNEYGVVTEVVTGDSRTVDYRAILERHNQRSVQLVIVHPPYFDIIRFSDDPRDLSNASSVEDFLEQIGAVADKARQVLDKGRYLVLVIGDKYTQGEWIPLGFLTMQEIAQRGFQLRSIVVKNFEDTTAKRNQKALWRYRALVGGFYIFKHEYIFIFRKR